MAAISEVSWEVDDFGNGKTLSVADSLGSVLYNIFVSEKGSSPSMPDKGIGIKHYMYLLSGELDEEQLKQDIFNNCQPLFEFISPDNIRVSETTRDGQLILLIFIDVEIEGTLTTLFLAFGKSSQQRSEITYQFAAHATDQI